MGLRPTTPFALAFAGYCGLTVVLLHAVVMHVATGVPHDVGDPLLSTALLWWNAHTPPLTARWWDGPFLWPAHGVVAVSDHRLGESLIASPLMWAGLSPLTSHNITLLLTFPLCAIAAHWFAHVLTNRHDASVCCGLAYGFYPFRVAHVPHLELLASFGMPVALGALHRYRESGRRRWLALFSAALVVQGLCASYYLLFFTIVLVLWVAWFIPWNDVRRLAGIAAATAAAAVALLPIIAGYARIHAFYGFDRSYREIIGYSADVTSLGTTSSLMALWGWTARWTRPELEIFPGLTIVIIACTGSVMAWRRSVSSAERRDVLGRCARWVLLLAAIPLAVAICGWSFGPWSVEVPGLQMSSAAAHKPFSVAVALAAIAFLLSSRLRRAWTAHSPLAFYLIAAIVLFACALGPEPAFNGHQILYKPPYAWLMTLPVFSSIRAPARFAMVGMLALAAGGALAFGSLRLTGRALRIVSVLAVAGIIADSWIADMPIAAPPDVWPPERAAPFAAVLELPLGDLARDMAAMYRGTVHGRPVVNGSSGYEPTYYKTLSTAIAEHDPAALDGLPAGGSLLAVIDKPTDPHDTWQRFLEATGRARLLAGDDRWSFVALEPPAPPPPLCEGTPVALAAVSDRKGRVPLARLTDDDVRTYWATRHEQREGEELVLDLGHAARPCALLLSSGGYGIAYPRKLIVDSSLDGEAWTTVAVSRTAGLAVRGALADPIRTPIRVAIEPRDARYLRLRLGESHPTLPWIVTDLTVQCERQPE